MFPEIAVDKGADLAVMDRGGQVIAQAGSARVCIEGGRDEKFLPQRVLLREYPVICKHFKICYFDLIVFLVHNMHFPFCCF